MSDTQPGATADATDGRKLRAIGLMLDGLGDADVAREVGVDRTTVWRWRTHDSAFVSALAEAAATRHEGAVARLQSLALEAVETIVGLMRAESTPAPLRLRAATIILERAALPDAAERRVSALVDAAAGRLATALNAESPDVADRLIDALGGDLDVNAKRTFTLKVERL